MRAREIVSEGQGWESVKRLARYLITNKAPQETINRRAVDALAGSMLATRATDYNGIDKQMKLIGKEFHVSPKKLHDLWVRKYHMSPDDWIKKRVQ
jgi:hypothetical protein